MASIFGHGVVAYTISKVASRASTKKLTVLAIISSVLPDIDILAFNFGIPYEAPLGHRGFTHSILFALLWAIMITFVFSKARKRLSFLVIFVSTISHGILDAMTTGGRGVGFFIPFDNTRYFFPFRIITVSPLSPRSFFSEWGYQVIMSELKYIFLPCLAVIIISSLIKAIKGA